MSLIKKIIEYNSTYKKKILFTTPSHSQGEFINNVALKLIGKKYFKSDFSEIDGFDNLRNPQGILKDLQQKLANIYGTKSTYILTNGSTSGIIAILNSILNENDKILVARNSHISFYNAMVVTGANPIWFMPDFDNEWGIFKGIKAEQIKDLLNIHKDVKALFITSPTYEGVFSEINEISKICKKNNVLLIVDEAHGALLNFFDKENSAITQGADACVQSLHKTAGALNPSALLHISNKSSIEPQKVQNTLNLINTTSPSYPIIAGIESTVDYLNSEKGRKHIKELLNAVKNFIKHTPSNVNIYNKNNDITKLLIKIKDVSPNVFVDYLNNKCHIEEEFANSQSTLFITGIGTTKKKLKTLLKAIQKLNINSKSDKPKNTNNYTIPKQVLTPRQAFKLDTEIIDITIATNRICGETIMNYPPGIPTIIPGEVINENIIANIEKKSIAVIKQ